MKNSSGSSLTGIQKAQIISLNKNKLAHLVAGELLLLLLFN